MTETCAVCSKQIRRACPACGSEVRFSFGICDGCEEEVADLLVGSVAALRSGGRGTNFRRR